MTELRMMHPFHACPSIISPASPWECRTSGELRNVYSFSSYRVFRLIGILSLAQGILKQAAVIYWRHDTTRNAEPRVCGAWVRGRKQVSKLFSLFEFVIGRFRPRCKLLPFSTCSVSFREWNASDRSDVP